MWRGTAAARPKAAERMTSEDFIVGQVKNAIRSSWCKVTFRGRNAIIEAVRFKRVTVVGLQKSG